MRITYGTANKNIDVTVICFNQLLHNNVITIPEGDHNRARIFTDPAFGSHKSIYVTVDGLVAQEYTAAFEIQINTLDNTITKGAAQNAVTEKIQQLHAALQIKYGNMRDELPEQKMAVRYLKGDEKVLEIGGNIGRNSLIIGSILNTSYNTRFVTMECDPVSAEKLRENRDLNGLQFHIETAALSKRKLLQRGWDTIPSDVPVAGYKQVATINYDDLCKKYDIDFDTLVLDCEGAFYYILLDMPEMLRNIRLIIMENDYHNIRHKEAIDRTMTDCGFVRDYAEAGGWGPCRKNFFEVWKK